MTTPSGSSTQSLLPPEDFAPPPRQNGAVPPGDEEESDSDILHLSIAGAEKVSRIPGGTFVLDTPAVPRAVWGSGNNVLAAEGEPTMITGLTGVGKTTLVQQVVKGRMKGGDVLGFPVVADERPVLYLACDRPVQAARSFRRMFDEDDRRLLNDRLVVWRGALPHDLSREPEVLSAMAEKYGAGMVVIDSLKDVVAKLTGDEEANRANLAFQGLMVMGVELLVLHHHRKNQPGEIKQRPSLANIYGSTWLTAGMGNVLYIAGEAGDIVVELNHLKQSVNDVGPIQIRHDHDRGETTVDEGNVDLVAVMASPAYASCGLTALDAAKLIFGADKPRKNDVEKARRKLDEIVKRGAAHKREGGRSITGTQLPVTYHRVLRGAE